MRSNIRQLSTYVPTPANLLPIQHTSILLPVLVKGRLKGLFNGLVHFRNYCTNRLIAPQQQALQENSTLKFTTKMGDKCLAKQQSLNLID